MDLREANRIGSQQKTFDVLDEPQEVETLDILETPQESPFNTPISEDSFTTATSIPEFNIATPNSSSTLYPNDSFDTFDSSNDNKFFNINSIKEESISSAKDFFNPTNNMTSKHGDMEVFDAEPNSSEFINDFKTPNVEDDKTTPAQPMDFNNDYNTFNDIEINSHNKFFTPVQDNNSIPVIETKLNNDVDPMAAVDNLVNTSQSQKVSGMQLKDAIATVRSCIEGLGANGFYIDVEEIDFDSNYQITMRIHKDN
jgi:hypothetical protein